MPMAKSTLTTATGKHLLPHCWATTLSDQILVNLAVIAMSKALTAMPLRHIKHNGECRPSYASVSAPRLSKVKTLTVFKSQRQLQLQAMPPVRIPRLCLTRPLHRIRWMPVELQVVFFMVQSLKMPPLTSTFPLKSSSNWTCELLKRVFEASMWHLLYSLCVRFLVIYCNFRSFSNAGNSFSEKGFTHILVSRFVTLVSPWVFWLDCVSPKYEPWLDQTRLICRRSVPKRYD